MMTVLLVTSWKHAGESALRTEAPWTEKESPGRAAKTRPRPGREGLLRMAWQGTRTVSPWLMAFGA
ncbi:hypothetical protein [uncultured Acetatifactor sp.]|uniref:hypothetical protein n=1 Tax=uncultured Acetatifactor sp. TaxID=1671927 RepID=UPI002615EDDB|nr:hypothetical protein [uncultured Acetatifactor sp.]